MWNDLERALSFDTRSGHSSRNEEDDSYKLIYVEDSISVDGQFLILHHLLGAVRARQPTILVGVEQSLFHYMNASRKSGCALAPSISLGALKFVDALQGPVTMAARPKDVALQLPLLQFDNETGMDAADRWVKALVNICAPQGSLLIVDCLQPLLHAWGAGAVRAFVRSVLSEAAARSYPIKLLVLFHSLDLSPDISLDDYSREWYEMQSWLRAEASRMYIVSPLATGVSREIHGVLRVRPSQGCALQQIFFHIGDHSVTVPTHAES